MIIAKIFLIEKINIEMVEMAKMSWYRKCWLRAGAYRSHFLGSGNLKKKKKNVYTYINTSILKL